MLPGTVTFPDKVKNTGYKGSAGVFDGHGYATDYIASDYFVRTAVFTPADIDAVADLSQCVYGDGMVSYAGVPFSGNTVSLYKVTFDPKGGSVTTASANTGSDGKLASLPTPTRKGYTFQGWYTTSGVMVKATTDTVFTRDTTLAARWSYDGQASASLCGGDDWCVLSIGGVEALSASDRILAAWYDESGKMLGVKMYAASDLTAAELTVEKGSAQSVKAFLLKDGTWIPITKLAAWQAEPTEEDLG